LFKDNVRIYAYPIEKENFERYGQQVGIGDNVEVEVAEEDLVTIENLLVADNLRNLYKYIRENGFLETIEDCDRRNMKLFSRDVYEQVKTRKEGWQECLPDCVADMIENQALWKD
ncbi:MAG TPA: nicotinate-nucleotide adenylyltransferase, partial [Opitutae bacterium]|nr:nicotinate-nucleotide adenylyltransferase [Opitutae bacterium]